MQKTDYMVFAGRQYFLGDKCQVRRLYPCITEKFIYNEDVNKVQTQRSEFIHTKPPQALTSQPAGYLDATGYKGRVPSEC